MQQSGMIQMNMKHICLQPNPTLLPPLPMYPCQNGFCCFLHGEARSSDLLWARETSSLMICPPPCPSLPCSAIFLPLFCLALPCLLCQPNWANRLVLSCHYIWGYCSLSLAVWQCVAFACCQRSVCNCHKAVSAGSPLGFGH